MKINEVEYGICEYIYSIYITILTSIKMSMETTHSSVINTVQLYSRILETKIPHFKFPYTGISLILPHFKNWRISVCIRDIP